MNYRQMVPGIFLRRPNRFIAHIEINGKEEICHVKNTGRCRELLQPGVRVWCQRAENPNRKTAWDLIAVRKGGKLINMDAQAPNRVFAEWAAQFEPQLTALRREVTFGRSRLDFCLETPYGLHYVEVKGVTLENDGVCAFPDAPTTRGVKHLRELTDCVSEGYEAYVLLVIQMKGVSEFRPHDETDPDFGRAMRGAQAGGVRILAVDCRVKPDEMRIDTAVAVDLIPAIRKKPTKPEHQMILTRILCLVFVACSFLFATRNIPIIVSLMSFSWGVVSGCFIGPYIWGLFSKKITKIAALTGMLGGLLTVGLSTLVISLNSGFSSAAAKSPEMGVSAMAISMIIVPLVSAFTQNTEAETDRVSELFNCFKEIK